MSLALLLLLIAQSDRRPTEHAWCQDDEDGSYNRASVRRILNGTVTRSKVQHHTRGGGHLLNPWGPPLESISHTEQSATLHTWWGPPLESVGATS